MQFLRAALPLLAAPLTIPLLLHVWDDVRLRRALEEAQDAPVTSAPAPDASATGEAANEPVETAPAIESAAPAATYRAEHLEKDIGLPPRAVLEITRRAVNDALGEFSGFMVWIDHASACYDQLAADDVKQRIYCLQFDAAAMAIEQDVPESWRAADLLSNDYYSPDRYDERQRRHLPPQQDVADAETRRVSVRYALNIALETAMADWLTERRSEREEDRQPVKPH